MCFKISVLQNIYQGIAIKNPKIELFPGFSNMVFYYSFAATLAQVSFKVTVRLKMIFSGVES